MDSNSVTQSTNYLPISYSLFMKWIWLTLLPLNFFCSFLTGFKRQGQQRTRIFKNHRVAKAECISGSLWPNPAPASDRVGCPAPDPGAFGDLYGDNFISFEGYEVRPGVLKEPPEHQFVPRAPCPGPGHHQKDPGSILLALSFVVCIYTDIHIFVFIDISHTQVCISYKQFELVKPFGGSCFSNLIHTFSI